MPSPSAASTRPPCPAAQGPAGKASSVQLEVVRGRTRQRFRPLPLGIVLVGSAPGCQLQLAAPELPELHSLLEFRPDGLSVRHLGQSPPLLVNGQPTAHAWLAAGDRIAVGPFVLVVHGSLPSAGPAGPWPASANPSPARAPTAPSDRQQRGKALADGLLADVRAARAQGWLPIRLYTAPKSLERDDVLSLRLPPASPEARAAASGSG